MKFNGITNYNHKTTRRSRGVLITNLGTPNTPTSKALRRYLSEFLSDSRVIEIPKPLWWLILNLLILPLRPERSAQLYQNIWNNEGSPLLSISRHQCEKLKTALKVKLSQDIPVALGMRYGNPSIHSALEDLKQHNVDEIIVLPLYPQYCAATTGSTFDAISRYFQQQRWVPSLRFISGYHHHPLYIKAITHSIERHIEQQGIPDKVVISYHGIPQRNLEQGDPYYCFCMQTTRLINESLIKSNSQFTDKLITTFQSRFGKAQWLQPYTDKTLKQLPGQGIKYIAIICPGFAADCLETLDEIQREAKETFMHAGGEAFYYIPCLNDDDLHIEMLVDLLPGKDNF